MHAACWAHITEDDCRIRNGDRSTLGDQTTTSGRQGGTTQALR
jgi:hypothetical protein